MSEGEDTETQRLRRAVSSRPDDVPARAALARRLSDAGRRDEALVILREGLVFAAADPYRLEGLADALEEADALPEAIGVLQSIARLAPDHGPAYARLARLWASLGEPDRAQAMADKAGGLGHPVIIAATAEPNPVLTRHLFDQYAETFDRHLVRHLDYAAPRLLEQALLPHLQRWRGGCVIDLGCGTGLMGERLRPYAGSLTGIDLSPGMLRQAEAKRLYDRLIEGEAAASLAALPAADLITAADMLVYVGDLAPLFQAVAVALKPGGLFAATAERHDGDRYALTPARRYAHAQAYLTEMAQAAGLTVLSCETVVLRLDRGQSVEGLMVLMEKGR